MIRKEVTEQINQIIQAQKGGDIHLSFVDAIMISKAIRYWENRKGSGKWQKKDA